MDMPVRVTADTTVIHTSGVGIHTHVWRPEHGARGIVVICHGFNSHGGQHARTAKALAASGLAVYALDLRGRGKSEGARWFVDSVGAYVADLAALAQFAASREGDLPLFVFGHSAGGVVAASYVLEHPAVAAGLICESSAFRVPAPALVLSLVKLVAKIAPRLPVLRLKNRDFSRDRAVVEALERDPLTQGEAQPAKTVAAMTDANERLEKYLPTFAVPLLVLHGTADKVTLAEGSRLLHALAGSQDKTLRLYDGHFHDLLADLGGEEVLDTIRHWIVRRLARARSAST